LGKRAETHRFTIFVQINDLAQENVDQYAKVIGIKIFRGSLCCKQDVKKL